MTKQNSIHKAVILCKLKRATALFIGTLSLAAVVSVILILSIAMVGNLISIPPLFFSIILIIVVIWLILVIIGILLTPDTYKKEPKVKL